MRTSMIIVALGLLGATGCARDQWVCRCDTPILGRWSALCCGCDSDRAKTTVTPPASPAKPAAVPPAAPLPPVTSALVKPAAPASPPPAVLPSVPLAAPDVKPEPTSDSLPPRPTPTIAPPEPAPGLPDRPGGEAPPRPKLPDVPFDAHGTDESHEPELWSAKANLPGPKVDAPEPALALPEATLPTVPAEKEQETAKPAPAKPAPEAPAPTPPTVASEPPLVLTGAVESWRRSWRLRYAAIDVEDPHGGRVTLHGDAAIEQLKEGQRVRVRGFLIPAVDRATPPTLQVQFLEVVD